MNALSQLLQELLTERPSEKIASSLEALTLADRRRAQAFDITSETVRAVIDFRIQLFKAIHSDFTNLCQQTFKLDTPLDEALWNLWLPLAIQIADRHKQKKTAVCSRVFGWTGHRKNHANCCFNPNFESFGIPNDRLIFR